MGNRERISFLQPVLAEKTFAPCMASLNVLWSFFTYNRQLCMAWDRHTFSIHTCVLQCYTMAVLHCSFWQCKASFTPALFWEMLPGLLRGGCSVAPFTWMGCARWAVLPTKPNRGYNFSATAAKQHRECIKVEKKPSAFKTYLFWIRFPHFWRYIPFFLILLLLHRNL